MIEKSGLILVRGGRVLLCRKKRGTQLLILPGGKREPGESALECLARELREELGDVIAIAPELMGTYEHEAAGDSGKTVRIELYRAEIEGEPQAQSEIEELIWFGPADDRAQLAPSLSQVIIPDLIARGFLAW